MKILIEGGHVTEFRQIFEHIPKTAVAEELGIHFTRMTKLIGNVNEIRISDIFLLSNYFEIGAKVLFELIHNQHNSSKKVPKKK